MSAPRVDVGGKQAAENNSFRANDTGGNQSFSKQFTKVDAGNRFPENNVWKMQCLTYSRLIRHFFAPRVALALTPSIISASTQPFRKIIPSEPRPWWWKLAMKLRGKSRIKNERESRERMRKAKAWTLFGLRGRISMPQSVSRRMDHNCRALIGGDENDHWIPRKLLHKKFS